MGYFLQRRRQLCQIKESSNPPGVAEKKEVNLQGIIRTPG
jgi:hypothetical protein